MTEDTNPSKLKVAVLVSGNGSNLQVLIDAMQAGELPIDIVGVISNNKDAYAITRASEANIEVAVLSHINDKLTEKFDIEVKPESLGKRMGIKTFERFASQQLKHWQPDLIVLAGFMRVLSGEFIESSAAPMINLHPSLLPKYKGLDTHQRAIESNDTFHGCSVHMVTAELDAGTVLTQAMLQINPDESADTLQKRVQKLEHKILPWTVLLIARSVVPLLEALPSMAATQSNTTPPLPSTCLDSTRYLPPLPLKLWLNEGSD